jgi:hypothetical protein
VQTIFFLRFQTSNLKIGKVKKFCRKCFSGLRDIALNKRLPNTSTSTLQVPTSTLDCIFDDSGEKKIYGWPVQACRVSRKSQKLENHDFCPAYATLGPYCQPMGQSGEPIFLFLDFPYQVRKSQKISEKNF